MSDSIGVYPFVTLHRVDDPKAGPLIVREQCTPINRPGVDGTAVMRMGQRSEPFQMRSGVDMTSIATGPTAIAAYSTLIGDDPVSVVWQGIDYEIFGCRYVVMDVFPLKIVRLSAKSGGLVSGATAWIEMIWTLQPVLFA